MMDIQRANTPEKFFSEEEKQKIIEAIQAAEKKTSGEIRLHLEKNTKDEAFERAVKVFKKIGMGKTAQKNGVLIYLATSNRKFVILGDSGINNIVPDNFWGDVANLMSQYFKEGKFCEGICEGIKRVGDKLKTNFPYTSDDVNELSNDISISKE
jgi:uncharacterized membrane protein